MARVLDYSTEWEADVQGTANLVLGTGHLSPPRPHSHIEALTTVRWCQEVGPMGGD